jgi:hypothetical protein
MSIRSEGIGDDLCQLIKLFDIDADRMRDLDPLEERLTASSAWAEATPIRRLDWLPALAAHKMKRCGPGFFILLAETVAALLNRGGAG